MERLQKTTLFEQTRTTRHMSGRDPEQSCIVGAEDMCCEPVVGISRTGDSAERLKMIRAAM